MSSVRLSDIPRTTGFRLALLFFGLFGAASLILFGFIYWQTAGYLSNWADDWLRSVVAGAQDDPISDERLRERLLQLNARAIADPQGRRPIAVFDATGRWIGGSAATLPNPLPKLDEPFDFVQQRDDELAPFRGMLHPLKSGDILFVAQDMREVRRFNDRLIEAMASGALVVFILGLAGAIVTGASALGRIDGVTSAIERIVNGNLSERLPSGRRGGDLNRLIQVVNRMLDEIERLMHEVKDVTDEVAHDLRTPLTRLLAGLERAHRRARSAEEYGVAVEEAIAETRGILATFGALLRIAEVESGARRAGFTRIELNAVAADVADFYEPLAERKSISVSQDIAESPIELLGDPSLLFEAIGNILENAIKFTPAGGRVRLHSFKTAARLGIEVTDSGPGIPEAEREAVLRRFHRVEKCRTTPGSGLGLSLAAAVARLHGLQLAIEDARPGCRVVLWRDGAVLEQIEHSVAADRTPVNASLLL